MNEPVLENILLRSPRTNANGDRITVEVKMVKASQTDLSAYSFLRSYGTYEEWVPTKELDLYKTALKIL